MLGAGIFVFATAGGALAPGDGAVIGDREGEGALGDHHGRFAGVGDTATGAAVAAAVVCVFLERFTLEGVGDAEGVDSPVAAVAVGEALSSFFFSRLCFAGLGEASEAEEAAGDSAADALAAGEVCFLACLCLAGLGETSGLAAGEGDWAERVARENPIRATMRPTGLFIVAQRRACSRRGNPKELQKTRLGLLQFAKSELQRCGASRFTLETTSRDRLCMNKRQHRVY